MARALVSIYKNGWKNIGGTEGNVIVRTPSDYSGSSSTIVNSARNSQGQVVGDVIAHDVAKVELKWNYLTIAEYSALAKIFKTDFFVPCCFFDVVEGTWEGDNSQAPSGANNVRIFYCGDRKVDFAHITLDSNGAPIGYSNVSLHLIDTGRKYAQ